MGKFIVMKTGLFGKFNNFVLWLWNFSMGDIWFGGPSSRNPQFSSIGILCQAPTPGPWGKEECYQSLVLELGANSQMRAAFGIKGKWGLLISLQRKSAAD
jgi:hypothetical protein